MMTKRWKVAVGALALCAASLATAPAAFAGAWSDAIGQSNQTFVYDGSVTLQVHTGIRSARSIVTTGSQNGYDTWLYTQCFNESLVPLGGRYYGSGLKVEYYCQGNNNLYIAQAYLTDN